jgi:hypothetical protein
VPEDVLDLPRAQRFIDDDRDSSNSGYPEKGCRCFCAALEENGDAFVGPYAAL